MSVIKSKPQSKAHIETSWIQNQAKIKTWIPIIDHIIQDGLQLN